MASCACCRRCSASVASAALSVSCRSRTVAIAPGLQVLALQVQKLRLGTDVRGRYMLRPRFDKRLRVITRGFQQLRAVLERLRLAFHRMYGLQLPGDRPNRLAQILALNTSSATNALMPLMGL